ncbi:MAG: tRNA (adenosine(37)-N6)-threonylcarbamoyltransferase complex ATPase subunit type 1 TsaE [Pseudomonadota bacterium]|nr:tRNA (adenosine(37)-N6)-threonylcarbamoyltransferase complex ATPase subunit type 1 TsaE [Pseudomonadota bacterium]HJO36640.1 tRNA (adenosine(37)-N6)-threonylcarbamoyltransferase complex ATPase subunit type 1 TsaE [Gammaproteobacteria bacterium]
MSLQREVVLAGETATAALGRALAGVLPAQLMIPLEGELGSGKTALARAVLRGLGWTGPVRSPTYTLLETYDLPGPPPAGRRVHHLDLYRLTSPEELEYLGLRDLLAVPACWFVEWPQRGKGMLASADLAVALTLDPRGRRCRLRAQSAAGESCLRALWDRPELDEIEKMALTS